jgi:hypothetical protein
MAPKKKKLIDKTKLISTFAENIEQLLDSQHRNGTYINCYSYVEIDGLPVDILISKENNGKYTFKIKIVNNTIFLDDDNKNDELFLFTSFEFNNIETILEQIEIVKKDHTFLDHDIISPKQIENIKIQRTFFPIPTDKNCSVCNEPTVEYTVCKHPICFRCRYNCIATNKHTCPICNFGKLNRFPNELIYHDP